MTVLAWFRALLVGSIVCDLVAWTWRDLAYTRALEPELAKGDQTLLITAGVFLVGAVPLWRRWRWSGAFMVALTVLAVVGRLARPDFPPFTTNNAIMLLEILAATAWGAMLAIAYAPGTRALFDRDLLGRPVATRAAVS
ncbi:MAG: hypothetical protein AAFW46_09955 [Pseudomonadota bacterium]